jgi:sortase A
VRQTIRITGAVLLGAGVLGLGWALLVWQWQDPVTALYTTYQQHRLAASYDQTFATYRVPFVAPVVVNHKVDVQAEQRQIAREARRYRLTLKRGQALGRLKVPRLGLSIIVVTGTDETSLEKGPGWFTATKLPGEGQLIYIAGHRTTYLAPFAHIDSLQRGDAVELELPYATFLYRVTGHVIVPSDDVSRLRSRGFETVALQACHPRFFATHRYIAYARPVQVIPRRGTPFLISKTGRLTAEPGGSGGPTVQGGTLHVSAP